MFCLFYFNTVNTQLHELLAVLEKYYEEQLFQCYWMNWRGLQDCFDILLFEQIAPC